MLLLACSAIGWIPAAEQHELGMLLMSFVVPLELLATIMAFLARDTLGATTLGLFTTSWLALGWSDLVAAEGARSVTIGIYLFGFATIALLLALMSTLGKPLFSVLLSLASARMVLSGVYEIGSAHAFDKAAGWVGLALSAFAIYAGSALALEDARQHEVLPLFRRGGARAAFEGVDEQLSRLEAEAGVRQQL
jgi:succinate-acetate transporter protein